MISFAVVMGVALAVLAGLAWLALLPLRQWRGVRRLRRQGLHRQARIEAARPSWLLAEGRIGFGALAWLAPVLLVAALLAGQGLFRLRWYQAGGEYSEMFSRGQPEFVVALVWIIPVLLALAVVATGWLKRRR